MWGVRERKKFREPRDGAGSHRHPTSLSESGKGEPKEGHFLLVLRHDTKMFWRFLTQYYKWIHLEGSPFRLDWQESLGPSTPDVPEPGESVGSQD